MIFKQIKIGTLVYLCLVINLIVTAPAGDFVTVVNKFWTT